MINPSSHVIEAVPSWRYDVVGCLWTSAGTLLGFHGAPILETLGAAWGFRHDPAQLRREEYYFPCPPGASLWEAIAPYHPVRSTWREPADAEEGWAQVRDEVLAGWPVIVAADNFDLPFRPAYQDVHTNHLVVVYGFDEARSTVRVLDAVPPRFDGDIAIKELMAARDSNNPELHARDMFFTNRPIANRWLEVEIDTAAFPAFDLDTLRRTIRSNLDGFRAESSVEAFVGAGGQRRYLRDVVVRLRAGETICDELFLVAGAVLAQTALHAAWLALAAQRFDIPRLAVAARSVERIAHHWSAVRIAGALTRNGEYEPARLERRFHVLVDDHGRALDELEFLLPSL
ncbi:hypothetical protein ABH935_006429 [Catenulispora sp. GAS73]|uniref:BtrH N-terminal domain-containing protein n=1 Tax=Catenulispora sp. GAS73 TaxID=3156269 RepID=UPI003514C5F5